MVQFILHCIYYCKRNKTGKNERVALTFKLSGSIRTSKEVPGNGNPLRYFCQGKKPHHPTGREKWLEMTIIVYKSSTSC
jgi:hypothetical protein